MNQLYNPKPADISDRLGNVRNEAVRDVPNRPNDRRYFSDRGILYSLGAATLVAVLGGCASTGDITSEGPYHRSPPRRAEAVRAADYKDYVEEVCQRVDNNQNLSREQKDMIKRIYQGIDIVHLSRREKEFIKGFSPKDIYSDFELVNFLENLGLDLENLSYLDRVFISRLTETMFFESFRMGHPPMGRFGF